jgi:FkbM family methyltransferase
MGYWLHYPAEKHNTIQKVTVMRYGVYEPETTDFILKNVKPGDVCVDIGAYIGYFSRLFQHCNASYVYAIDPNPEIIETLNKNIHNPNFTELKRSYEIINCAAGDKKGELPFYVNEEAAASSLHKSWENEIKLKIIKEIKVPVDRVDNLVRRKVDVIKMDAEGHEIKVFQGMEKILKQKPRIIIFESIDKARTKICKRFLPDYKIRYCDKRNYIATLE